MKKLIFYFLLVIMLPLSTIGMEKNSNDSLVVLDYPSSLENLLEKFKGQVVYVDVLASWCKPCIEEFAHAKKLDDFFKKNNIVKIYITIDQAEDNEKCEKLLVDRSMTGYLVHYHPNKGKHSQFSEDVGKFFLTDKNGNFDIGIPRFGIVDKNGVLVMNDAPRPSTPEELTKKLKEYL